MGKQFGESAVYLGIENADLPVEPENIDSLVFKGEFKELLS